MSKSSGVTKRVESWTVKGDKPGTVTVKVVVAHRHSDGRFHGATNHKQRG